MGELKRVLSYKVVLLITINSIMGTGIFFLPALGAAYGGPASIISWFIFSVISLYIAMCFGELTSMYPKSGGVYEFSKHAYGRFTSFIVGWMNLITANITIAMVVLGAIRYLLPAGSNIPVIVVSIILIFVFSVIAYRGMEVSATMLVTFSIITLGTIVGILIPAFFHMSPSNLEPFLPFGTMSIFLTIFFIAQTFFGWEGPTFLAGEVKDGEKVMPRALVTGTAILSLISLVFVFVSMAAMGWIPFSESAAPINALAAVFYGGWAIKAFSLLVYLALIGSVASWIVSTPRLILSMAKDKLFLSSFKAVHPRYHTPNRAIILQFFLSCTLIIIGAGSYYQLLQLLVPLLLVFYCIVLFSVVILRYTKPSVIRHYRAPLGKVGPFVIILIFLSLLLYWILAIPGAVHTFIFASSLVMAGIPFFFLIEVYYNPKVMRRVDNIIAYLTLWTEQLMVPKSIRKEIIHLVGDLKGKAIFEFGCSVGTLTLHLAEEVGKDGKVFVTDISEVNIGIARKRFDKAMHDHVIAIHDRDHPSRIHPDIPVVDVIVGIAALGYVEKIRHVLLHMNLRLPIDGKICFVEYDKFFRIIPTVEWLAKDSRIKHFFRDAGFRVDVKRRPGLLWENIFIYGEKFKEIDSDLKFDPSLDS